MKAKHKKQQAAIEKIVDHAQDLMGGPVWLGDRVANSESGVRATVTANALIGHAFVVKAKILETGENLIFAIDSKTLTSKWTLVYE